MRGRRKVSDLVALILEVIGNKLGIYTLTSTDFTASTNTLLEEKIRLKVTLVIQVFKDKNLIFWSRPHIDSI